MGGLHNTSTLFGGIAGSSRTWVPAMTLLQSDYTALAPDFLGHGASWKGAGITTSPRLVRFAYSTGEAHCRLGRPYVACHLEFVAGRPGLARTS
jgi:pimeloyl-ACP methyl ester carboxylesterase